MDLYITTKKSSCLMHRGVCCIGASFFAEAADGVSFGQADWPVEMCTYLFCVVSHWLLQFPFWKSRPGKMACAPWKMPWAWKCHVAYIHVACGKKGHDSPERNPFRVTRWFVVVNIMAPCWIIMMHHNDASWWRVMKNHRYVPSWCLTKIHHDES